MRRTEALQGVRMAVFLNILNRWESAELNQEEAAELLGVSERTFRRWTRRYEEQGEIDRGGPTQVGRALAQLGVEHIGAFSPHSPSRDGRPSGRSSLEAVRSGRSGRCRIVPGLDPGIRLA